MEWVIGYQTLGGERVLLKVSVDGGGRDTCVSMQGLVVMSLV